MAERPVGEEGVKQKGPEVDGTGDGVSAFGYNSRQESDEDKQGKVCTVRLPSRGPVSGS